MSKQRLTIALVTGGYTKESAVFHKSNINIKNNLDAEKFDVYQINIERDVWYYDDGVSPTKSITVDRNDFSLTLNGKKRKFDCVFMGIGGTPGEDGKLQGYFDMINMPYVGCSSATSSALTMNKRLTIAVAGFHGINVSKSICVDKSANDLPIILQQITLPVFVKANNGGSSIGTTRVETVDELPVALCRAFEEDREVMIEEALDGREFTVGVCKLKGSIDPFPVTEIISNNAYYDYDAKYSGKSTKITPANIDETLKTEIQQTAIKIYEIMQCSCIIRIDFIYKEKDKKLYLLEVNTVPRQTDTSLVTQQVKAMGLTLTDFYTAYIEEALGLSSTI